MDFQRILVIKLRHLGDVLLSTPLFTNLKRAFPSATIDAYVWKEAAEILEGHPSIDEMHLYDRNWKKLSWIKRIWRELALLRRIRKKNYDCVIHLTEGDRGRIVAWISGAKVRVGVDPVKKDKRKMLTHLVKPCPTSRHAVERDLDALRVLGIYPPLNQRKLYFSIPLEAEQKVEKWFVDRPYTVIHSLSRWRFKCPPRELFQEVVFLLGRRVVLTGGPSEREYLDGIAAGNPSILNLGGETSLKEMGAVMKRAEGVITVDSVSLHMACALKIPVVALFGPTSEEKWGPWLHSQSEVIAQKLPCRPCLLDGCGGSKMSDCLWTLSPKVIVQAYERVISGSGRGVDSLDSLRILNSPEINRTE